MGSIDNLQKAGETYTEMIDSPFIECDVCKARKCIGCGIDVCSADTCVVAYFMGTNNDVTICINCG